MFFFSLLLNAHSLILGLWVMEASYFNSFLISSSFIKSKTDFCSSPSHFLMVCFCSSGSKLEACVYWGGWRSWLGSWPPLLPVKLSGYPRRFTSSISYLSNFTWVGFTVGCSKKKSSWGFSVCSSSLVWPDSFEGSCRSLKFIRSPFFASSRGFLGDTLVWASNLLVRSSIVTWLGSLGCIYCI